MEFYRTKLKNGVTILLEKRDMPITGIFAATKIGAAFETARNKGISHFFEHMVFKGTKTKTKDEIRTSIEKVGGILNAFTGDEITAFWCKIPAKHFTTGAGVIFDLVTHPTFDSKEMEKERGVILAEIDMIHDTPTHFLFDKIKELLYKPPFAMPIIGFKKTVSGIKRKDLLGWHDDYSPNNIIVSVSGNANLKEIYDLANEYFGKMKSKKMTGPKVVVSRKNDTFVETRHGLDQTHFALGFHMPTFSEKLRHSSEVFNAILGEGMSSILFREVREKRGLAYRIQSLLEQERDYGYCVVYAGTLKKNLKKVKEIVLKEIKSLVRVKSKDLEQAKEQKIGNWELSRESCTETAKNLILQEMATCAEDFYIYPEKISDVKLSDIKKLSKIKNYSVAIVAPEK